MAYRSSGNATVDAMGSIAISGNVIPEEWYKQIRKKTGKPDFLAIIILADIVYWHRPTEIRDERSGEVIGWRKKFRGKYLQKGYGEYAEKFGESKDTIKRAFVALEKLGVIKRLIFNVKTLDGRILPNQMFIDLDVDVLKSISYPQEEGFTDEQCEDELIVSDSCEIIENPDKTDVSEPLNASMQNCRGIHANLPPYPCKSAQSIRANLHPYPSKSARNTYITTENTYKDSILSISSQLERDDVREKMDDRIDTMDEDSVRNDRMDCLIKKNINYDWHMQNDDYIRREDYHQLYLLMHDVLLAEHQKSIMINKTAMDPDVVKSRFLKLNESHLEYVIESLQNNPNVAGIRDIRSYLLTCLYNAPVTMGFYWQQAVNHDTTSGSISPVMRE